MSLEPYKQQFRTHLGLSRTRERSIYVFPHLFFPYVRRSTVLAGSGSKASLLTAERLVMQSVSRAVLETFPAGSSYLAGHIIRKILLR